MNTLEKAKRDGVYPITFHNYGAVGREDGAKAVDDWHEMGITVGKTGSQGGGDAKPHILAMLDRCAELGMMCFVNDTRCTGHVMIDRGEDAFRKGFEAALKDYGDHPALFGFEVGDEPAQEKIGPIFRAHAVQREMAPDLTPFLSLGGYDPHAIEWMQIRSYGGYLDRFVREGKTRLFFHNNYSLAWWNAPNSMENFYRALKMYVDSAARRDVDIWNWVSLCCTPHGTIPNLTGDDIRRQLNAAAACGFRGIAWYLIYIGVWQNYRNSPINEHGRKTEMYWWMSDVVRRFLKVQGPVLVKLKFQRAFFVGGSWGDWPSTIDSELIKSAFVHEDRYPFILTEFKDDDGNDYVAITNHSRDGSGNARITWHGTPDVFVVAWEGSEGKPFDKLEEIRPGWPIKHTGHTLGPGQMELLRVVQKNDPADRDRTDGGDPGIMPNAWQ
jgi:hypothetical protein